LAIEGKENDLNGADFGKAVLVQLPELSKTKRTRGISRGASRPSQLPIGAMVAAAQRGERALAERSAKRYI
jgi:hypothetical protein